MLFLLHLLSFNPRPREGGDDGLKNRLIADVVSIHAPAKGATYVNDAFNRGQGFNPRPREGGDSIRSTANNAPVLFQSTPPRRGRQSVAILKQSNLKFQSTPPRRGRRMVDGFTDPIKCFNPRPREGGDRDQNERVARLFRFNPRPREGGDSLLLAVYAHLLVSIHAPAKGATMRYFA